MTMVACAAVLAAAEPTPGETAWKRLQRLVGVWEGAEAGRTTTMTYTMVSGGHSLMESMKMPAPAPDMVTIYHRDGASLVATHYCSMGNQPRMRATDLSGDPKSIRFRFADITNLAKPGGDHIKHLTVTLQDPDHLTQEWVSNSSSKEEAMVFKWTRKK